MELLEESFSRKRIRVSTAIESCTDLAIENCTLGGGDDPLVAVPLPMLDLGPSWVRGAEASEGTKAMA